MNKNEITICVIKNQSPVLLKAKAGDNLLSILNANQILSRSACQNGNCRICRCKLLQGQIDYQNKIPLALSEDDIKQSWILPCISILTENIQISDLNYIKKR